MSRLFFAIVYILASFCSLVIDSLIEVGQNGFLFECLLRSAQEKLSQILNTKVEVLAPACTRSKIVLVAKQR